MTSRRRVVSTIVLAAMLIMAGIAIGVSATPVVAQDDDEVPPLPGVYHGELTVADGDIDGPVVVEAVADGEVQDTMIVESDGAIGGPTISDDKLEVQEPDEDGVEFHVAGEPATILSVDGATVNEESIPFDSGTQEIALEIDAERLAPDFDVSIDSTTSPVEAGEELAVTASLSNVGAGEATADVDLLAFDNTTVDTTTTTLERDAETTTTLVWNTTAEDGGSGTITVETTGTTATATVEVEPPDITQPDPGGVGAQPPTDDDDDDGDDSAPAEGVIHSEVQDIATSEEFGISQVRFTEPAGVASITWDTADIEPGSVSVETYDERPTTVAPVPGAMISLSEVTVPSDLTDEPATVELRADRDRLANASADVEDLRIVKYTDDEWTPLETSVSEEDDTFVTLEAETPGFSFVAVQATREPTATIDAPAEITVDEELTLSGADSTTQYGEITAYDWTIDGETATGETVTETVSDAGTVTVELTVTNDAGETDTTTAEVSVTAGDDTPDDESTDSDDEPTDPDAADDGIPGFGVLLTLAGILVAALLARRR